MITLENESDLHKKDVETLFFFFLSSFGRFLYIRNKKL